MPTATRKRITKGLKFHWHHADANPCWEVKHSRGQGVWICQIVDCPDYSGVTRAFTREEIHLALSSEEFWSGRADDHESFYASLKPGQIVHYNNGFNNYVRCEAFIEDGETKLKPIALVGQWREYDLPRRNVDGSISYNYYPAMVLGEKFGSDNVKTSFTPNYSNIYEAKPRVGDIDPTDLEPIDLSVPPMTDEQKSIAAKWQKVAAVSRAIEEGQRARGKENNPQKILDAIETLMKKNPKEYLRLFTTLSGTPV